MSLIMNREINPSLGVAASAAAPCNNNNNNNNKASPSSDVECLGVRNPEVSQNNETTNDNKETSPRTAPAGEEEVFSYTEGDDDSSSFVKDVWTVASDSSSISSNSSAANSNSRKRRASSEAVVNLLCQSSDEDFVENKYESFARHLQNQMRDHNRHHESLEREIVIDLLENSSCDENDHPPRPAARPMQRQLTEKQAIDAARARQELANLRRQDSGEKVVLTAGLIPKTVGQDNTSIRRLVDIVDVDSSDDEMVVQVERFAMAPRLDPRWSSTIKQEDANANDSKPAAKELSGACESAFAKPTPPVPLSNETDQRTNAHCQSMLVDKENMNGAAISNHSDKIDMDISPKNMAVPKPIPIEFRFDDDTVNHQQQNDESDDESQESNMKIDYETLITSPGGGGAHVNNNNGQQQKPKSRQIQNIRAQGMQYVKDLHLPTEAKKQPLQTRCVVHSRRLDVEDYETPSDFHIVKPMSQWTFDEHGRPVWTFATYGASEEMLYRFKVEVDESSIPGAGLGAFISFLGSLTLKRNINMMNDRLLQKYIVCDLPTLRPLEAKRPNGRCATLRLTGENIHKPSSTGYCPKYMYPLQALHPTTRKKITVHVTGGQDIHFERDEAKFIRKRSRRENTFGYLRMLEESDYVPTNVTEFTEQNNAINLGRYGPLRKEDWKAEHSFQCKSFILQHEPDAYAFQLQEKFLGQNQMVDVTDDCTGLPHSVAKKTFAMYINEVGHDLSRRQNVFHFSRNGRSVEYAFVLPNKTTLKVGERMELLTSYRSSYERLRELKGYGLKNIYMGKKSAKDEATRLRSSFWERGRVLELAKETDIIQMANSLEILCENTHGPIVERLEEFLAEKETALSNLHLCALRRIHWLTMRFLENLETRIQVPLTAASCAARQCFSLLTSLSCPPYILKDALQDKRILPNEEMSISDAIKWEAIEEACFVVRQSIRQPLDQILWCPVGSDLTKSLASLVAEQFWPMETAGIQESRRQQLADNFLAAALAAAKEIERLAGTGEVARLAFSSGLRQDSVILGSLTEVLKGSKLSRSFFLDHSLTPKGFTAVLAQHLAYTEACSLGFESSYLGIDDIVLDHRLTFAMCRAPLIDNEVTADEIGNSNPSFSVLSSIPRPTATATLGDVNVTWYYVWQVAYLLRAFLFHFCRDQEDKILDKFCEQLGIDRSLVSYAVERGIRGKAKSFRELCQPKELIECKKVFDLPKSLIFESALDIAQQDVHKRKKRVKGKKKKMKRSKTFKSIKEEIQRANSMATEESALKPTSNNGAPVLDGANGVAPGGHDNGVKTSSEQQDAPFAGLAAAVSPSIAADTIMAHVAPRTVPTGVGPPTNPNSQVPSKSQDKKSSTNPNSQVPSKSQDKKSSFSKIPAKLVWEGEPDDKLFANGWPPGWLKRTYQRQSGASKGHFDSYWFTPRERYKLRSHVEIRKFMGALVLTGNDEVQAKKIFKKL